MNRFLMLIALAVLVLGGSLSAQSQFQLFSDKEAATLMSELVRAVDPAGADCERFPDAVREKLAWLAREAQPGGSVRIQPLSMPSINPSRLPLLATTYEDNKYVMYVPLQGVYYTQRVRYHVLSGVDRKMINTYALGLFHEAIHMEIPELKADRVDEEVRAWRKTVLEGVRSMKVAGEPIDDSFLRVEETLRKCADAENCKALRNMVGQKVDRVELSTSFSLFAS